MNHRELELKFSLPLSLQDKLDDDAANAWDRKRVWSCYYDTPDGELTRARMAVRVRRHGERWLQTVKAELPLHTILRLLKHLVPQVDDTFYTLIVTATAFTVRRVCLNSTILIVLLLPGGRSLPQQPQRCG